MSYNAEWAAKPLAGEASDLLILQEREQRYLIGVNGRTDRMIIPTAHFCELRDRYEDLIRERNGVPEEPGEMSVEQAIAVLNPETMQTALESYRSYGGFRGKEAMGAAYAAACRIAVKIMREKLSVDRNAEMEESDK